jgi:hypothetical protein
MAPSQLSPNAGVHGGLRVDNEYSYAVLADALVPVDHTAAVPADLPAVCTS